jgi:hypothetical protein
LNNPAYNRPDDAGEMPDVVEAPLLADDLAFSGA